LFSRSLRAFAWRRALVYTHRWLGIAGSLLFVAWFASGIVLMYHRMPRLTGVERLQRARPVDLSTARVDPARAIGGSTEPPTRLRIGMLHDRPVYRLLAGQAWAAVYADTGETVNIEDVAEAVHLARVAAPEHASTLQYEARLDVPDQWTLQLRPLMPLHRIVLGDAGGSAIYIAVRTGEPVLITTRRSRAWGYAGAVVHWLYFAPLRRLSGVWAQTVIWTALAGGVLSLTGLAWGVWQWIVARRPGGDRLLHSPYAGAMRWHHYAGLVFGVATLTWVFSGLLSMNPWGWARSTSPTRAQREAMSAGPLSVDQIGVEALGRAVRALGETAPVKELEILQVGAEVFAEAYRVPAGPWPLTSRIGEPVDVVSDRLPLAHGLISLTASDARVFARFDAATLEALTRRAMPGVEVMEAVWLDEYDAYYYARGRDRPLPVLRVRFADTEGTWLYVDPARGEIVRRDDRRTRLNRWLYHGLHSLDVAWLRERRPLWDLVVVMLSLGGIVLSLSSAPAAWRRLGRHARRVAQRRSH
jgi:hypothetical protein